MALMTEQPIDSSIPTSEISERDVYTSAGVGASILEYLHACPICTAKELKHYCRVPSLFNEGEFIRYERCLSCGIVFRNPRLTASYREDRYVEGSLSPSDIRLPEGNQVHYRYMMRRLQKYFPSGTGRRLLDFGCGSGGFLLEARASGFDPMGLELNRALAEYVNEELGIETYQGLITDPEFAGEKFNIVISSQVFEHLVDPRATLVEIRDHLISPGLILIEVPNLRHIKERLRRGAVMDDSHLFYFSASSLPKLLCACGFDVLEIQEGLRPYRVLKDYDLRLPQWFHTSGQNVLSALQIKTGLSVLAQLRD